MKRAAGTEIQNDFYLQLGKIAKSFTDADGNFIFDVEASNENLDLEGERVLQRALLDTKDYFLASGVISKDHLHQKARPREQGGGIQLDEQYVIGEPIEVYTDGTSTRVRGKLYRSNPHARKFMALLRDGSTRVKASVGGLMPQKVVNADGTKTISAVLWNDLALTIAPVNPTVSRASIVKSMTSAEFVKSLSAGYGTDAGAFSGGRALQEEDMGHETVTVRPGGEEAAASLIGAIGDGRVKDAGDAMKFLGGFGYSETEAREIMAAVVENHGEFLEVLPMMQKNPFGAAIDRLQKALAGKPKDDGKADPGPDGEDQEDGDEENEENEDEEDVNDATPLLKTLSEQIDRLVEENETMAKALTELMDRSEQTETLQKSIGESLVLVMQGQSQMAVTPQPRKSAVTALEAAMLKKGGQGAGAGAGRHRQLTPADLDGAREILAKALSDGKISILEVARAETQINKSIKNPAFQIDPKFLNILGAGNQKAEAV